MHREIKRIDPCEALRFLGWRGAPVEDALMAQIERFSRQAIAELSPQVAVKAFELEGSCAAAGTSFSAKGKDAGRLLAPCHEIILLAATLGAQSERMILREQARSPESALVLDAVLSAAIEALCDETEAQLRREYGAQGLFLTDRFSPGYGDMPMEQTREICAVLSTERSNGLTVSASGVMIPRKSVTAIIGVSRTPVTRRTSGCAACCARARCPNARLDAVDKHMEDEA